MKNVLRIGLLAASFAGCDAPQAPPEVEAEVVGPNSASSAWVEVAAAGDATLLEAPAEVVADPDAVAEVAATFRVHVDEVLVRAGDQVAAGDVLLRVTAPGLLEAAAAQRSAEAHAAVLRARRERLEQLRREGLMEQSKIFELDVALAEVDGRRRAAAATLRASGLSPAALGRLGKSGEVELVSPIAGVVREVEVHLGQVREPGAGPMLRIVGSGGSRVQARLVAAIPEGSRFEFVLGDGRVVDLGERPTTTLVVPEDGTTLAWWDVAGDAGALSPGLPGRVRGRVVDESLHQVPSAALAFEAERTVVFRRAEDGQPTAVAVEVVAVSGATALVRGPLSVGESIVSNAATVTAREGAGEG